MYPIRLKQDCYLQQIRTQEDVVCRVNNTLLMSQDSYAQRWWWKSHQSLGEIFGSITSLSRPSHPTRPFTKIHEKVSSSIIHPNWDISWETKLQTWRWRYIFKGLPILEDKMLINSPCKQHQTRLALAHYHDGNLFWLPLAHYMNTM